MIHYISNGYKMFVAQFADSSDKGFTINWKKCQCHTQKNKSIELTNNLLESSVFPEVSLEDCCSKRC